jgi:hypothetical protein
MNFFTACKMLLNTSLWEEDRKSFSYDALITKDGYVRILATTCCYFREGRSEKVLYKPNFIVWPIITYLGNRLYRKICL